MASNQESAPHSDKAARRASRAIRLWVLGIGLALITGLGIAHQNGVAVVGVDALCPFGGIETLWTLIMSATLVQRVAASSVILLAVVAITALVFRRAFCGSICPLGAVQEFAGKLGRLVFRGARPSVPAWLDRPARFIKYGVLIVFAVWSWQAASLVLRPYDPWVAWMHLTSKELLAEFSVGLAILGVSVAGSVVYERFFCKYLCPMGAFLGAVSRVSLFKVRREAATCTDCKACDKACPANVKVSTAEVVNDAECINCNECVNVCPAQGTLSVSAGKTAARRVLSPNTMLALTLVLVALGVALPTVTGSFAWTTPTLTETVAKTGGSINPEDIKGSMTVRDISKATGISEQAFQEKFGIAPAEMNDKVKDLAEKYGFDVHTDLRGFVTEKLAEK